MDIGLIAILNGYLQKCPAQSCAGHFPIIKKLPKRLKKQCFQKKFTVLPSIALIRLLPRRLTPKRKRSLFIHSGPSMLWPMA